LGLIIVGEVCTILMKANGISEVEKVQWHRKMLVSTHLHAKTFSLGKLTVI